MLARQKLVLFLHQYLTVADGKQHLLAFPSLNWFLRHLNATDFVGHHRGLNALCFKNLSIPIAPRTDADV
jgi:hypothetical protein